MLVLSRGLGEKVMIGDGIEVQVLDIERGRVRLGFTADRSIPIYRSELLPLDDTPRAGAGAAGPPPGVPQAGLNQPEG